MIIIIIIIIYLKERNYLFNATLNTFYFTVILRYMVKDHSVREESHGLLFPISSKCTPLHRQDSTYDRLCLTSYVRYQSGYFLNTCTERVVTSLRGAVGG